MRAPVHAVAKAVLSLVHCCDDPCGRIIFLGSAKRDLHASTVHRLIAYDTRCRIQSYKSIPEHMVLPSTLGFRSFLSPSAHSTYVIVINGFAEAACQ